MKQSLLRALNLLAAALWLATIVYLFICKSTPTSSPTPTPPTSASLLDLNSLHEQRTLQIPRLRMTRGELEEFRSDEVERLQQRGLSLRTTLTLTTLHTALLLDTLVKTPTLYSLNSTSDTSTTTTPIAPLLTDSLLRLQWRDSWVSLTLDVAEHQSRLQLTSTDTLRQRLYRIPYRWWIFRWGTKAVRQEIASSNPHTRLVYAEYIELE